MVNGAQAWATVTGPLTSGMVGLPVTIEYDEAWDGLTKNLVCRCSPWGSDDGEVRTILNVGETAVVAHEVMQAGQYLHLGIEGFREDGTLVMPTTWARCGRIEYGANADGDPSADPELPIWGQLQAQIGQLDRDGIPQETLDEVLRCAEAAVQAQKAAEAAAERAEAAADPGGYGALVAAQIDALDGMFQVGAYDADSGYAAAYAAFRSAFGLTAPDGGGSGEGDSGGSGGEDTGGSPGGDDSGGGDSGGDDSGGEETGVSNESVWTDGVAYTFMPIPDEYPDKSDGAIKPYNGWTRTPHLYCEGASKLRVTATATTSALQNGANDNAFYDVAKNYVNGFSYAGLAGVEPGTYVDVDVPDNAAYFILSGNGGRFPGTGGSTPNGCITITPLAEVSV